MVRKIAKPTRIEAAGTKPKVIEEFVGRVNSGHDRVSVAHMVSPAGWEEPAQTPEFDEVTVVLRGRLRVEHEGGYADVAAGETVFCGKGERVRYSNPFEQENEYWAICVPAFSMESVHREE